MEQVGGWTGVVAYITGIVSVYYAVKNRILTWPWGIISVILFGYIFYVAKDPSNALLQILYYLPISFYGWYVWLRRGPKQSDDLPISLLSTAGRIGWTVVTVLGCIGVGVLETHFKKDAPMPFTDASTTVMSVVAQYLQTRKVFESWIIWILADIVYAFYLFPHQQLTALATLYVLFLIMAFLGAKEWVAIMKGQHVVPEPIVKGYEAEAAQED
jgi:nicotinamide mononucleotide transporter